jgi:hypothetical protein
MPNHLAGGAELRADEFRFTYKRLENNVFLALLINKIAAPDLGRRLLPSPMRDSALVLRSSSLQGASVSRNRSFRITSEDSGVSIFWSCYGSWTHWAEILLGYLAKS